MYFNETQVKWIWAWIWILLLRKIFEYRRLLSKIFLFETSIKSNRATFVRLSVCLFLFSSQVLGPIFMKLGGWTKVDPRSVLEGFIFAKVKVTGVKGQITFFCYSLVRSWPNLVEACRLRPEPPLKGHGVKGQGHRVPRSNNCFLLLLGPNLTKLGGSM